MITACNDYQKQHGATTAITEAGMKWLSDRGFIPVEREVWAGGKWVVDIVGACSPSLTECKKLGLVSKGEQSRYARFNCLPARPIIAAVEVKVTRADYRRDLERKFTNLAKLPAHMPILLMPAKMLRPDEYPEGWTILEYSEKTGRIRIVRSATLREVSIKRAYFLLDVLARAQANRIRYSGFREAQLKHRSEEAGRMTLLRLSAAFAVLERVVVEKQDLAETIRYHVGRWNGGTESAIAAAAKSLERVRAHLSADK